jgi:hypothetical protein
MFFGPSIFRMLWVYWTWAVAALRDSPKDWRPLWLGLAAGLAITVVLLWFVFHKVRHGDRTALFLLVWFVVVISPVLPLKNHFTEYYVLAPTIGLSILGAWAIAEARGTYRAAAFALTGLYFVLSISDIHIAERYNYEQSRPGKYLVQSLETFPNAASKKFLLTGIDNDLFWRAVYPDPFRLIGIRQIYLVPGSEKGIEPHPEWGGIGRFIITPEDAVLALKSHQAIVVQLDGKRLRDVTDAYLSKLQEQLDRREVDFVDVADPLYMSNLGGGWYPAESGFRWMAKTAVVRIARPGKPGQKLKITGYSPAVALAQGPLEVEFRSGEILIGKSRLKVRDEHFTLEFPLPAELVGTGSGTMELAIQVSRTVQVPGDTRELGLVFGTFTLE